MYGTFADPTADTGPFPGYNIIPLSPVIELGSGKPPYSPWFLFEAYTRLRQAGLSYSYYKPPFVALPPRPDIFEKPPYLLVRATSSVFWVLDVPHDLQSIPDRGEAMYSNSRKWVSDQCKKNEKMKRENAARSKLCPDSFAWTLNYDLDEHKKEYAEDLAEYRKKKELRDATEKTERVLLGLPAEPEVDIKPAFGGKTFENNLGSVLGEPTVFCPNFNTKRYVDHTVKDESKETKELAPWPCREEQKYEGDDRISTDPLHRRFLGLPRVPGNNTVNWMQRTVIPQYRIDDRYRIPDEDDIYWRFHTVENYFQFTDEEGREAIGTELMEMLDE